MLKKKRLVFIGVAVLLVVNLWVSLAQERTFQVELSRSLSPEGNFLTFALVDRPVTKAADRAGDDTVAAERVRPRAKTPFVWSQNLEEAMTRAKAAGRRIIIDFETTWCGPCKTMDEWIWTDAEVSGLLAAGFVGVKLDGDVEKVQVKNFGVSAYPTVLVLDPTGKEASRFVGYRSSKELIEFLSPKR
ncbi:MAG: thioredoxin family protein [Acidobacteriia bacterium]|nr:thioredoxin family protein [Terriglobia bacterium]